MFVSLYFKTFYLNVVEVLRRDTQQLQYGGARCRSEVKDVDWA